MFYSPFTHGPMQNVQTDYLPIIADVSAPLLTAAARSVRCWLPTPPLTRGRRHWRQKNISVAQKYLLALSSAPAVGPMINCLTCDELWENIDCGVSATSTHTQHKHCTGAVCKFLVRCMKKCKYL